MHAYNEVKRGRLSLYERHVLDDAGKSISATSARIPLHRIERQGKAIFLLYDDGMNVISGAYSYLNIHMIGDPVNSRKKAAHALRLLYCFLSMSHRGESGIDDALVAELRQFLRGIGNATDRLSLKTQRCNNTVNEYLAIYRSYLDFLGMECPAMNRTRIVRDETIYDGNAAVTLRSRYTANLPGKEYCDRSVPKYITPNEFRDLLHLAISKGDKTAEVIMRLMYVYGLRIGEVLGLTIEDVTEVPAGEAYAPMLIIRNRTSDRPFQHAKGKKHPLNPSEYSSPYYADSRDDVPIDYQTFDLIVRYVNEAHERAIRSRPADYAKGSADVASIRDAPDDNHYVFLNRYGRPLSGQTWGNSLKRYFEEAGIARGWSPKNDNLSHRFRHGFAMMHAHFRPNPIGALELQKLLRHKWLSSTMVYYNLTTEEELRVKSDFQSDLRKLIPELGAWPYGK